MRNFTPPAHSNRTYSHSIASQVINSLVYDVLHGLIRDISSLKAINPSATLTAFDVQCAVRLRFPGELAPLAVKAARQATQLLLEASAKRAGMSLSQSCGLYLPVSFIRSYLKNRLHLRVTKSAAVSMTTALEYLASEILELSCNVAVDNNRIRITPRCIFLAIHMDYELTCLLPNISFPGGGVLPEITVSIP